MSGENQSVALRAALRAGPALLALAWFWQTIGYEQVWDDLQIFSDPAVFASAGSIWAWATQPFLNYAVYFRPLPLLMLAGEYHYASGAPWLSHLVNVLLHAFNTFLVSTLALHLLGRERALFAALAGLLYAFHPALIEGVAWISARFDLLVTTFALLLLWTDRSALPAAPRALLCGLLFLCGALSKEMVLGLALALPLWHWQAAGIAGQGFVAALRAQWMTYAACALAGMLYLLLRSGALPSLLASEAAPVWSADRLLLIAETLGRYLRLALWPLPVSSPIHLRPDAVEAGLAAAALLALLVTLWRKPQPYRQAAALGLCFLLALAPVSQLFPLTLGDSVAAERFLLLPLVFVVLAAALLFAHCTRPGAVRLQRSLSMAVLAAWVLLALLLQVTVLPAWRDEQSLWTYAYARAPLSKTASTNLLAIYIERDELQKAAAFAEQLRQRQNGLYPGQQINYAYVLSLQGRHEDALGYLQGAALATDPQDRVGRFNLYRTWGFAALNAGDLQTALAQYTAAAAINPSNPVLLYWQGIALMALGDTAQGRGLLDRAYAMSPAEAEKWRRSEPRTVQVAVAKAQARGARGDQSP